MPPLARNRVRAAQNLAAQDHAAADTRAEDHAEHHLHAFGCAVGGLGQRETIRIVGDAHCAAEHSLQLRVHGTPVQAHGVGVFEQAVGRRQGPGRADADNTALAKLILNTGDQ
jgi:hypothetical protein